MFESVVPADPAPTQVSLRWGVKIRMRDGIHLNATVYLPADQAAPLPAVFTLTPYVAQTYHDQAVYFASHGYPFLTVDVRGRGNSEGEFKPFINEGKDGHDIVEWLARQPYCNGKIAMWGGSYGGLDQWNTAAQFPPHLASIAPVASPYIGVDFPIRGNVAFPYLMQWLIFVWGRTSQEKMFKENQSFWNEKYAAWFELGAPFKELDTQFGSPSAVFQEWLDHPMQDEYWDQCNPTAEQYARLAIPTLTITGSYDDDQPGALTHYHEHLKHGSEAATARHYLVMGPWDHPGTRIPQTEFLGLEVGPASLLDLRKLHCDWYDWTMKGGAKPTFLRKNVAYYVIGADRWRYADSLEAVTARRDEWFLHSMSNPDHVFHSGVLRTEAPVPGEPNSYIYDPRDTRHAKVEKTVHPESLTDQRMVHLLAGQRLIYHSAPFDAEMEISGFFKLSAWLAIDQPDTDFRAAVYEIDSEGRSLLLSADWMRARHRQSMRAAKLIDTREPLRYDFDGFTFISRLVKRGHRLRLVIGPINSIYFQKNFNSGGSVSDESMKDARPVTVKLFHDPVHPSALTVPFAHPETPGSN
jgi:putative CocE/NonD family hydrolase